MTRFVLHIGPHKTGSTHLQEAFARLRPQLAAMGTCFPSQWGPKAHHRLLDLLRVVPNPELEAQFAALHAANHQIVLISVEGLNTLPKPSLAYLRHLIGDTNPVRVVYYVRSWASGLQSIWIETLKYGARETLPEFLLPRLANPGAQRYLNFAIALQNFVDLFGMESLSLVAYDRLRSGKVDLFAHFCDTFLDWRDRPALDLKPTNVSPGPHDAEVIRALAMLNRVQQGGPLSHADARKTAGLYLDQRDTLPMMALRRSLEAHTTTVRIDETWPPLLKLQNELYQQFGATLVKPRNDKLFFPPRKLDIPFVRPDYLLDPGVLDELRTILRLLHPAKDAAAAA